MLTGRPAFEGEDVPEILSRVLQREPDWNRLPAGTPAGIRQLLRRCLQKNRMRRLHAADTRIEMEEAQDGAEADGHVAQAPARRSKLWVGIAAISSLTAIAFATLWAVSFNWPEPPEIRVEVNTPSTADPISFAISPDGRRLVFSASNEGQSAALRR